MIKEKIYTGNLNITESKVFVDTEINYRAIEINYIGTLAIESLLPSNYLVTKGSSKVIILNFSNDVTIESDLFKYMGQCLITEASIYKKDKTKHKLLIARTALQLWNTLRKQDRSDGTKTYDYDYLTRNWEDMKFEGRSNDIKKLVTKNIYDKEANTNTLKQETIEKPSNVAQNDIISNKLTGLYTKGQEYKKVSNNEYYSGNYYININTKKIYTESGELLIAIKDIKQIKKGKKVTGYGSRTSSDNY